MSFKQTLSGSFFRKARHGTRIRISDICESVGIKKTELMNYEHEREYPKAETELKLLGLYKDKIAILLIDTKKDKSLPLILLKQGIEIRMSYIQ